jgi:hypothetical protein
LVLVCAFHAAQRHVAGQLRDPDLESLGVLSDQLLPFHFAPDRRYVLDNLDNLGGNLGFLLCGGDRKEGHHLNSGPERFHAVA